MYLFSLALCLKSSIAFLKRVTLKRPLSLSSNSSLEDARGQINTRAGYAQYGRHISAGSHIQNDILTSVSGYFTDFDY